MNKCTTDLLHNIMCSIIATKTCDNRVKAVGNFTNKTTSQLRPLQAGPGGGLNCEVLPLIYKKLRK